MNYRSKAMYVEGVKRSSKYTIRTVILRMLKVSKETKKMQGLYAVYVEDVERSSKYIVKTVMLCMLKVPKETQNTL